MSPQSRHFHCCRACAVNALGVPLRNLRARCSRRNPLLAADLLSVAHMPHTHQAPNQAINARNKKLKEVAEEARSWGELSTAQIFAKVDTDGSGTLDRDEVTIQRAHVTRKNTRKISVVHGFFRWSG